MTGTIPFTQYLLPHGRQKRLDIKVPDDIAAKAARIIAAGYCFEIEVLTTGHVSVTIADHDEEVDVAIEVCPNGPEVSIKIKKMIEDFDLPPIPLNISLTDPS